MLNIKSILTVLPFILCQICIAAADTEFYSKSADEYQVMFEALIHTEFNSLDQVRGFSTYQKQTFEEYVLKPTTKFLFGPLTNRSLGGEQKGFQLTPLWAKAYIEKGIVVIPFEYSGQWLVNKNIDPMRELEIPLPLNKRLLKTPQWKNCTDPNPGHQDVESFWYYWDPERAGCDHQLGTQYQLIKLHFAKKTIQTSNSYPEYPKMIRNNQISMTFGFGYVEDPHEPKPFADADYGMSQFRSFISAVRSELSPYTFKEIPIFENEYLSAPNSTRKIGTRFQFTKQGLQFEVKVVSSGAIDQMELFAKSFSHDHDAFFGWFGHSRVGNGFDAFKFNSLVQQSPAFYQLTPEYQMIYWAGCNSYSYYTMPFFDFKSDLLPDDPNGTKSLDIISNALPSYFSLNASNAKVLLSALLYPEKKISYQDIIGKIEKQSYASGIYVLVNVLGDEDNAP